MIMVKLYQSGNGSAFPGSAGADAFSLRQGAVLGHVLVDSQHLTKLFR